MSARGACGNLPAYVRIRDLGRSEDVFRRFFFDSATRYFSRGVERIRAAQETALRGLAACEGIPWSSVGSLRNKARTFRVSHSLKGTVTTTENQQERLRA